MCVGGAGERKTERQRERDRGRVSVLSEVVLK